MEWSVDQEWFLQGICNPGGLAQIYRNRKQSEFFMANKDTLGELFDGTEDLRSIARTNEYQSINTVLENAARAGRCVAVFSGGLHPMIVKVLVCKSFVVEEGYGDPVQGELTPVPQRDDMTTGDYWTRVTW